MNFLAPLIISFVLVSQVAGSIQSLGYWSFMPYNLDSKKKLIVNQVYDVGGDLLPSDPGVNLTSALGCTWIAMNHTAWWLQSNFSKATNNLPEYAIGFWVSFESTISDTVFQFGNSTSYHYVVSSSQNGKLDFVYYKDSSTTDPQNNFSINVPLSNFYTAKWFFILFDFLSASPSARLKIAMIGSEIVNKTSVVGSSAPFQIPYGTMEFGKSIIGKFFLIIASDSFSIFNSKIIMQTDRYGGTDLSTGECVYDCIDDACSIGGICLSWLTMCTCNSESICSGCPAGSERTEDLYCHICKDGYSMKNYHCCADANNCTGCSEKSTVCDSCDTGNFLYYENSTSTACLCNFYVACENSCKDCDPGPDCYDCVSAVVQDESTCKNYSIGFQMSFENSYIVIDFAHPLLTGLSKNSFQATSNMEIDIPTTEWTLTDCAVGSRQCKIKAPNILESDFPVMIDISFEKV